MLGTPLSGDVRPSTRIHAKNMSRRVRGVVVVKAEADKVAITGATGLVGSRLVKRLIASGTQVNVLTRDKFQARNKLGTFSALEYFNKNEWEKGVANTKAVVNLAGEPISTRWSDDIKKEIFSSRVSTTTLLADLINKCPEDSRPKVFVSGSAIGYYGTSDVKSFTEESDPGNDFLANLCKEWEAESKKAKCDRVVNLRTGLVLAKDEGVLGKMAPIFQLYFGGPIGKGSQWMSWIHHEDFVNLILKALEDEKIEGALNGTAPNPMTMNGFCDTLGRVLQRPVWIPVPDIPLQILLGEGAVLVLEGQKVLPKKAEELGFEFKYPSLGKALQEIMI